MRNLPNVRVERSWIECCGVKLERHAKLECSEVEVVRNHEKC